MSTQFPPGDDPAAPASPFGFADDYGDPWASPVAAEPFEDDEDAPSAQPELDALLGRERDDADATPDYYAVLNVERGASDEDIRNSYRRLALVYHPDRVAAEDRAAAARAFDTVQRAFDVLSNPRTRALYDAKGEEGLKMGLAVGSKLTMPDEIFMEYQRLLASKARDAVTELVEARGTIVISLDAEDLVRTDGPPLFAFQGLHEVEPKDRWLPFIAGYFARLPSLRVRLPELRKLSVTHSFSLPTAFGSLHLRGSGSSRNGIGSANVVASFERPIVGYTMGTAMFSLGGHPSLTAKVTHRIDSKAMVVTAVAHATTVSQPPILTFSLARDLVPSLRGYAAFSTGLFSLGPWGTPQPVGSSSFTVGLARSGQLHSSFELTAGIRDSRAELGVGTRVGDAGCLGTGILARGAVQLSASLSASSGLAVAFEAELGRGAGWKAGMAVELSGSGVALLLRHTWLGQKISVPVRLGGGWDPGLAVHAAAVPILLWWAAETWIVGPRRRRAKAEERAKRGAARAERARAGKERAEEAQRFLKPVAAKRADAEARVHGLIIVKAVYGDLADKGQGVVDVAVPLQAAVLDSQLRIAGGHSKSSIPGFYNIAPGRPKRLRIEYRFRGDLHSVEVDDTTALSIPVREHRVSGGDGEDVVEGVPVADGHPRSRTREGDLAGPAPARF
ncbi:hypothetical protein DFJ74DRAFT_702469 [Hyaloraphidium curvatum]|nr:hypothetical protein DFJ74DRAFT_702469 [Hyaloraphidium curvatum]